MFKFKLNLIFSAFLPFGLYLVLLALFGYDDVTLYYLIPGLVLLGLQVLSTLLIIPLFGNIKKNYSTTYNYTVSKYKKDKTSVSGFLLSNV